MFDLLVVQIASKMRTNYETKLSALRVLRGSTTHRILHINHENVNG